MLTSSWKSTSVALWFLLLAVGSSSSLQAAASSSEGLPSSLEVEINDAGLEGMQDNYVELAVGSSTILGEEGRDLQAEFKGTEFEIIVPEPPPPSKPVYVPFNFSYVFILGGHCGSPGDWYTKWAEAGRATLNDTHDVINICANETDKGYGREFHVQGLKMIEQQVGDKLDETLVITVAIGLESDWSPVADLLRRGMAFFHAKEDPLNFNLTEYGLIPEDVLYFYFRWDEIGAAERGGTEICRVKGGVQQLKVAKVHVPDRNGGLNYRVDIALETFKAACPDTELIDLWTIQEWGPDDPVFRTTLLFNPLPDVVFCGHDTTAAHFLSEAEKALTPDQYSRLATTGWDNTHPELLKDHKILTTVDQMVHYPNLGVWKSIGIVTDLLQENGFNSTKILQDELGLENSLTIAADTLAISSDRIGFLIQNLLQGYDAESPPYREVEVSTGLFDVTISEMIPFEGKFQAVLWVRLSWNDPRLKWNPFVYKGNAPLDSENVWTPGVYFKNTISYEELYVGPAVVNFDGQIVMESNVVAEFLCSTTEDLRSFPFDSYTCSMDLGAPKGITLDQKFGFHLIESDPHFATDTSTAVGINNNEEYGEDDGSDQSSHGHTVYFQLYFKRRPFTAYVRLILPAILINLVGFMAFWIPEVPESVALGVTSLLCSLAFRETVDMPDTADVTWTEVFVMINISYQASVMLIIWISYGSAWTTSTYRKGSALTSSWIDMFKSKKRARKSLKDLQNKAARRALKKRMEIVDENDIPLNDIVGDSQHANRRPSGRTLNKYTSSHKLATQQSSHNITTQPSSRNLNSGNPDDYRASAIMASGMAKSSRTVQTLRQRNQQKPGLGGIPSATEADYEDEEIMIPAETGYAQAVDYDYDKAADIGTTGDYGTSVYGDYAHLEYGAATTEGSPPTQEQSLVASGYNSGNGYAPGDEADDDTYDTDAEQAAIAAEKARIHRARNRKRNKNDWDPNEDGPPPNVDWIGRWFVVPSYFIVMMTLLFGGWGFY